MNEYTAGSPVEDVNRGIEALQWFNEKVQAHDLEELYKIPHEELVEKINDITAMSPAVTWVIRMLGMLEARSVLLGSHRPTPEVRDE